MLKIPSAARMWTSCATYRDTVREGNDYASSVKIKQLLNCIRDIGLLYELKMSLVILEFELCISTVSSTYDIKIL
jgi:hypothetical protein